MTDGELRIGTTGWSIPGAQAALLPGVVPERPDGVRFSVKAIRSLQVDGDAATAFVIRRDIVVEGL